MSEVGAITKSKRTEQGNKYFYRGIDDVINALNPVMAKYKLFVVPEVLDIKREERTSKYDAVLIYSICTIKYTFYASDGSNVSTTVIGEAFDSGDKSINKAMSVAFKYACFQTFCIPTEEMKDPDAEVHEIKEDPKPQTEEVEDYNCEKCGAPFKAFEWKGKSYTAKQGFEISKNKNNGKALCNKCKKEVVA
jgi:hypothetical protein